MMGRDWVGGVQQHLARTEVKRQYRQQQQQWNQWQWLPKRLSQAAVAQVAAIGGSLTVHSATVIHLGYRHATVVKILGQAVAATIRLGLEVVVEMT